MERFHDDVLRLQSAEERPGHKSRTTSDAGGIGRSFLKGAANAGVAYGAQWKMTHDSGSDIPPLLPLTNGRVFGVGPQIDMPVFAKGLNVGLVSFRYMWLVGAKTALGAQVLTVSFTFARIFHP